MSRIGKLPVQIPSGVEITLGTEKVDVKGPKGNLSVPVSRKIDYKQKENLIILSKIDDSKEAKEQYGLRRTLLNNAVIGVTKGYEKALELVGVGYKVSLQGQNLVLNVGYSKPVNFQLPENIQARAEGNKIFISGLDKQLVGEIAAKIRQIRPPEPYKGKGIKYVNEQIRRKAGKSAKK